MATLQHTAREQRPELNRLLTTGEMADVTGVEAKRIGGWAEAGFIRPVCGGTGSGNHRRYSPVVAVAVKYARKSG
jgi:hypothetical protein